MRVQPGTTIDDIYNSLTKTQQARLAAVETARERQDRDLRAVANRPREAVRKALVAGVPARLLADRIGVSPARVYQMREEAEAYAEEIAREKAGDSVKS